MRGLAYRPSLRAARLPRPRVTPAKEFPSVDCRVVVGGRINVACVIRCLSPLSEIFHCRRNRRTTAAARDKPLPPLWSSYVGPSRILLVPLVSLSWVSGLLFDRSITSCPSL